MTTPLHVVTYLTSLLLLCASSSRVGAAPTGIGQTELSHTPEKVAAPTNAVRTPPAAVESKTEPAPLSHPSDSAHVVPGAVLRDDPFAPYLAEAAPEILREIPAPEGTPSVPETIRLRHVVFKSYT
ncbi:MAG TPA: hypothetical protein PLN52_17370, partial [Opitutaceae bacterium]|nr:hypothetical protein [Opitutaceae bacterium]